LQAYVLCEDTTLTPPIFPAIFFPALGVFWIFLIWVLWTIVKCLRGLDKSLESVNAILKELSDHLGSKG